MAHGGLGGLLRSLVRHREDFFDLRACECKWSLSSV